MMVAIGVIGTGQIAQRGHLPGLLLDGRCSVVAIAGVDPARAEKVARKFDIPAFYMDWRRMLADEHLDAITITTPPAYHHVMAVEAMQMGLDVLIEKPLAISVAEVNSIVQTAESTGRIAMVEQSMRYNPVCGTIRELVGSGVIGEVTRIHAGMLNLGPRGWAPESSWFFDPEVAGGGIVLDTGVHIVDLLRFITGENITNLHGELVYRNGGNVEEEASIIGQLESGVQVAIGLSWFVNPSQTFVHLYGSKGNLCADIKSVQPIKIYFPNGDILIPGTQSDWYGSVWSHFLDCCLDRSEPLSSVADNKNTMIPLLSLYSEPTIRRVLF